MSATIAVCVAARSATSNASSRVSTPAARASAATRSAPARSLRQWITTLYPSVARRRAIAAPMPRLEPVTSTHSAIELPPQEVLDPLRNVTFYARAGEELRTLMDRALEHAQLTLIAQEQPGTHGEPRSG